jgi:hypothetical protein
VTLFVTVVLIQSHQTVSKETLIWRQLLHHHVLPFICIYYYPTDNYPKIGLVSPWMKHGNVQQFLRQVHDADRISLVYFNITNYPTVFHESFPLTGARYRGGAFLPPLDATNHYSRRSKGCRCCLPPFVAPGPYSQRLGMIGQRVDHRRSNCVYR